ncbi:Uncharacterised protein [Mycobacteroides abscessus subsp. abscessus]|nr:Uncharacterised protein [Mycobacteroides abscessus subsp. abscessus]
MVSAAMVRSASISSSQRVHAASVGSAGSRPIRYRRPRSPLSVPKSRKKFTFWKAAPRCFAPVYNSS